jgi:hypothetical protein
MPSPRVAWVAVAVAVTVTGGAVGASRLGLVGRVGGGAAIRGHASPTTAAASRTATSSVSAASAMPVPAGCSWGQLCAYHEAGFGGNTHAVIDPVPSGSCDGYSRADWRSAINITNQYARFWDHNDCTGANKLLPPGYSTADFGFDANGVGGL